MKTKRKNTILMYAIVLAVIVSFLGISPDVFAIDSSYKSFGQVKKAYLNDCKNQVSINDWVIDVCGYRNVKIKTKSGVKTAKFVECTAGAYMTMTDLWVEKGGNYVKKGTFPGRLTKISKNKKYLLFYSYVGTGSGAWTLYKYNAKSGNYKKTGIKAFSSWTDETKSLKKLEKKCKVNTDKFKNITSYKKIYSSF